MLLTHFRNLTKYVKIFTLFRRNLRQEPRERILEDVRCYVVPAKSSNEIKVAVADISKNGFSFFVAGTSFNLGESICARMTRDTSQTYLLNGQIVAQQVCYLENSDDVDKAFIRYSVRLDETLSETPWSDLRSR